MSMIMLRVKLDQTKKIKIFGKEGTIYQGNREINKLRKNAELKKREILVNYFKI